MDSHVVLVANILLAIECSGQDHIHVIEALAEVDLTEFQLSQTEVEKLETIIRKLNAQLMQGLSQSCLAASITAETSVSQQLEN